MPRKHKGATPDASLKPIPAEILDQFTITPQHRVAVIGDGKLGQLIARVLATTNCDLLLIGKHAEKLQLAAQADIATRLLSDVDPARQFDFVVEASGAAAGLQLALKLVKPRGAAQFVGALVLSVLAAPFIGSMIESIFATTPLWLLLVVITFAALWLCRVVLEHLLGHHAAGHVIGVAFIGTVKLCFRIVLFPAVLIVRLLRGRAMENAR